MLTKSRVNLEYNHFLSCLKKVEKNFSNSLNVLPSEVIKDLIGELAKALADYKNKQDIAIAQLPISEQKSPAPAEDPNVLKAEAYIKDFAEIENIKHEEPTQRDPLNTVMLNLKVALTKIDTEVRKLPGSYQGEIFQHLKQLNASILKQRRPKSLPPASLSASNLLDLPADIISVVVSFFPMKEQLSLRMVCSFLRDFINSEEIKTTFIKLHAGSIHLTTVSHPKIGEQALTWGQFFSNVPKQIQEQKDNITQMIVEREIPAPRYGVDRNIPRCCFIVLAISSLISFAIGGLVINAGVKSLKNATDNDIKKEISERITIVIGAVVICAGIFALITSLQRLIPICCNTEHQRMEQQRRALQGRTQRDLEEAFDDIPLRPLVGEP